MALNIPALIKTNVAKAKGQVQSVLVPVQHRAIVSHTEFGPEFAQTTVEEYAIVEDVARREQEPEGTVIVNRVKLTFMEWIDVKHGEQYTLLDGRTLTVEAIEGLREPDGLLLPPIIVWLGE